MAFTVIRLVDKNKITEKGPVGFSWTTLFFGFFVPLTRNDGIYALIMLGASIITLGIAQLIFPFIYNKIFIQNLVKKGFKAKSYEPIYKDSKRLSVKKEKAMIREEAGFAAEGIVAKTFKEKSTKEEEILSGDVRMLIGTKDSGGGKNFLPNIIIFITSYIIIYASTQGLDFFTVAKQSVKCSKWVKDSSGNWGRIKVDPCIVNNWRADADWYYLFVIISSALITYCVYKIWFDKRSK